MMFGFSNQWSFTNPIISQTYAASCGSAESNFEWCELYCKDHNDAQCIEYKQGKLWRLATTLDAVLSFLYLIMRPILYVAGLAMDNTLIYAQWLGLTGLLYKFWTIMRTFSNFAIVFLLVRTIGSTMFKGDKWAKELGKMLLAIALWWVAINASWFLIWAMVDLSTIATYGVGTIPLSLSSDDAFCDDKGMNTKGIKDMEDIKKLWTCRPLLATHSTMNLGDTLNPENAAYKAYYSYKDKAGKSQYFLTCPFKTRTLTETDRKVFVTSFIEWGKKPDWSNIDPADTIVKEWLIKEYCVVWSNQLLQLENFPITVWSKWYYASIVWGMQNLHNQNGLRIKSLVDGNKGMIGVMYMMYGSMLWFSQIKTDVNTDSPESQIIQFIVKWFFGFAILFPLIALCVVLIMRVAILWLIIGFAPLLVLLWVLQWMGIKNESLLWLVKSFGEKANLKQVISLLLQPVLVVFVISIWLMFMDSLMSTLTIDDGFGEALQCQKIDENTGKQCCKIVDFMDICFENFDSKVGTDISFNYFTFAIINIIGVMLLWFMVFAVMKSNKITAGAVEKIEWMWKWLLWSIPIVPWFNGSMVWLTGAKSWLDTAWKKVTDPTKDTTWDTITQPFVDRVYEGFSWAAGTAQKEIVKVWEDYNIDEIKWVKGQEFGQKLLVEIGKAKQNVRYATSDKLLDISDPKIWALFDKYNISNKKAVNLFTNPQFMADQWLNSKTMWEKFKVWDGGKTQYKDMWRKEYMSALREYADEAKWWLFINRRIGKATIGENNNLIRRDEWFYNIKTWLWTSNDEVEISFKEASKKLTKSEAEWIIKEYSLDEEQVSNLEMKTIEEVTMVEWQANSSKIYVYDKDDNWVWWYKDTTPKPATT